MKALQPTRDPRLISFNTLRKTVGWLGILIPAIMITGNYFYGNCRIIQDTISHYYYTITGNLFTGIVCCEALFLIVYRGYDLLDNVVTSLAGYFAFGIAMYPTNDNSTDSCAIFHLSLNMARNYAHYGFSALFFITLACISLFLFTKSRDHETKRKKIRNKIYIACGITIFIAISLIAVYSFTDDSSREFAKYKPEFWLEWVALFAFGTSWLVKGELILEDNPGKKS